MWLIIISTIDNGTHGVDLLDHRQRISLSKCGTCKLCLSHGLAGVDYTASLIRKVNAGSCSEVERTLRFEEIIFSHFRRDLHHTIVTGIGNNIGKCFCSMGIGPYRAFNKCRSSFRTKGLSSVADKTICLGNGSHLKSRTHNNGLYYWSRFVCVCHTEITPHSVQGIYGFLIVHGRNLTLGINVGKVSRIIQIVTVTTIHGQNFSCFWIFDNDTDILGSHFFFKSIYILLHNLLKPQVKGSFYAFSVGGLYDRLLHIRIVVDVSILSSVNTAKRCIVITLQTCICHISGKCKTNGVTGCFIERIGS